MLKTKREPRLESLAEACRSSGCTRRQTEVVLGVAEGASDAAIAANLRVSTEAVDQTLRAGIRKLEQRYPARHGRNWRQARDLLKCFENKRSCGAPRTAMYDAEGRRVGAKAKPFGMAVEDLVRDPRGSTQVVLELACRITGTAIPALLVRRDEGPREAGAE
jgi:hypothetical protein